MSESEAGLAVVPSIRLTDRIGIGVLTRLIDRDLVDDVLAGTGRAEQRSRLMPARVVVYYVLALCLFFGDAYEEVMRLLVAGLHFTGAWQKDWQVPTTGAISQARQRLGAAPLQLLFERVAVPCAQQGTQGAWLGSRRLMAIDGFVLDIPDTKENDTAFGRSLDFRGLGREICGVFPGQADGMDFCGFWLISANSLKSGGDDDAAELGGHVGGGRLGLRGVPGRVEAAGPGVGRVVAGGGVPADRDCLAGEHERDRALDRGRGAVAGLPTAEQLLRVLDRDLDGLITNGKFCCVRRVQLSLTWWRRPLDLRRSALHTDVALVGEPDDPDLDRVPPVQPAPRRRAPVGSGLPAAGASGRAGRAARPDADN